MTKQDKDSPLMAHVRLDNVLMPEARQLKLNAPKVQVLASSLTNDPLYAAIDRPEGKVLVLTVNLDKGDLPLQTAFPILVANALGWFAGTKGELRESLLDRGGRRPRAARRRPSRQGRPGPPSPPTAGPGRCRSRANKVTVGPLDQCGVWSIVRPRRSEAGRRHGRRRSRSWKWPATWRAGRRATSGPPTGRRPRRRRWRRVRRLADLV